MSGTLKGYDQLLNMVLEEAVEYIRGALLPARMAFGCAVCIPSDPHTTKRRARADKEDPSKITNDTRKLGLIVCRGTVVMTGARARAAGSNGILSPSHPYHPNRIR